MEPRHLLAKSGSVLKMRRRHCLYSTALSDHLVTASSVGCGDDYGVGSDVDIVGGAWCQEYMVTRCVTSKVNEAVKIKRFSVIDDIEQDTHGMGQDFGMPEIQ